MWKPCHPSGQSVVYLLWGYRSPGLESPGDQVLAANNVFSGASFQGNKGSILHVLDSFDVLEADKKHGDRERGYDIQQGSPKGNELAML